MEHELRHLSATRGGCRMTFDSEHYWRQRYALGGHSGVGSQGAFALFKAEVLNQFVARHHIESVIEFGCGDGQQLALADYHDYTGVDVSETAVAMCRERFNHDTTKRFVLAGEYSSQRAELALSLDVIYHLTEDETFGHYMRTLFGAATRHVIVYSSDTDQQQPGQPPHIRHRRFTGWVAHNFPGWSLVGHLPNRYPYRGDYRTGSWSEFFFFRNMIRNTITDSRPSAGARTQRDADSQ